MLTIEPGKEEEFRYVQMSLIASEQIDRLIAGTEPPDTKENAPVSATSLPNFERRAAQPIGKTSVAEGLIQRTGRALRRTGEALEEWGGVEPRLSEPRVGVTVEDFVRLRTEERTGQTVKAMHRR